MTDAVVQHDWGVEADWARTSTYGAKMMMFPKSKAVTPLFFQKQTNKSWFVNNGSFIIRWVDTSDGKIYEQQLTEGQVFEIPAMQPVSLECCQDNSSITEVNDGFKENDVSIVLSNEFIGNRNVAETV